jgi:protein transport protein SEC24
MQEQQPGSVGADGLVQLPNLVPAAGTKLLKAGAYLVDNGQALYLIIGPEVSDSFLNQCFGVSQFEEISNLPELDSPLNQSLIAIIEELRRRSPGLYQPLILLPDNSPTALQQVRPLFVEDATPSELSYADYLMSLNRLLLSKLEDR